MQVGLIGLGKMGLNLGKNLIDHNHQVVAFDLNPNAIADIQKYGAKGTTNLSELFLSLDKPRVMWIMVPHSVVDSVLSEITPLLEKGDIVIEAGNSHYKESIRRYNYFKEIGVNFLDTGTSGGMEGARNGANYMVGGDAEAWSIVEPIFRDTSVENGYIFTGKAGGGHFLKMVHNGIEYVMMAAIGEGFELQK
ncbi:6-phosphogluconate dehydrogenase (decarboxylating) [Peribacillus huizhouensis]|uniref:6-phosphogluconate dehydrogenase (Decarboxylating) n=1 Tax=Peribacillus huizhouensis TaxID=1501239 RepID=A0ABR6CQ64_9BACI|nr:6-phosphogluconate dehydrogenase (decarboxylating) [Peribacillus huizhouensis]